MVSARKREHDNFSVKRHAWKLTLASLQAILQFIVWTALEAEGLGAALQHFNPLITPQVLSTWNLPSSWSLVAQIPFGKPSAPPGERTYLPVEGERFKVFGKD